MSADAPPPAPAGDAPAATKNTYTQGHHPTVLRSHQWRTAANSAAHLLPLLRPGQRVLDVGCGPGTISCDLAAAVGPAGYVLGVDASGDAVARAREEAGRRGVGNARFEVGDAGDLPSIVAAAAAAAAASARGAPPAVAAAAAQAAATLADARPPPGDAGGGGGEGSRPGFDVVHAHQLLQHTASPGLVLASMRAAARRPGGVVAAREGLAFLHHPPTPLLARFDALFRDVARAGGAAPDAAAALRRHAREAGFAEAKITFAMDAAWCFAAEEDLRFWCGEFAVLWSKSRLMGKTCGRTGCFCPTSRTTPSSTD
jgi:SAM-dependent methyltransferase